jgi:hypothetical protein
MSETLTVSPSPTAAAEIRSTLGLMFKDGDAIVVSHFVRGDKALYKAAFHAVDAASAHAESLDADTRVAAIYVNLQQLKQGSMTDKRTDAEAYVRFLVDIDRRNKKVNGVKVMGTDEERAELWAVAQEVNKWVSGLLEAHCLVADSGNGYHLCWNLRPNAFASAIACGHDNQVLVKDCLLAVKQRFDSDLVEIDDSLGEPEQIIRLWGTHNRYTDGCNTSRPWRLSSVIAKAQGTASLAGLTALACEYKAPSKDRARKGGDAPLLHPDFDEDAWWDHYESVFTKAGENNGWQVTSICVPTYEGPDAPGHRHTGSTFSGVRFDRGRAEFHCFSDHSDMTFGQVMEHLNQCHEPYPGVIWDWSERDAQDNDWSKFDIESADEAIESTDVPLMAPVEPEKTNGNGECNLKGTLCPVCNVELIGGALDKECKSCMRRAALRSKLQQGEVELTSGTKDGGRIALAILEAHNIETEELTWLWPGRILGAKITIFAGLGDCGKSTVLVDLIARITTGRDFPDGAGNALGPKRVLMAFTEDDASDTEVPKLTVAGADLTKVLIISKVNGIDAEGQTYRRAFNLTDDLKLLEKALKENPDIALVALDPIAGFWGLGKDTNKDDDMRPVMESLKEMCARL